MWSNNRRTGFITEPFDLVPYINGNYHSAGKTEIKGEKPFYKTVSVGTKKN